MGEYLRTGRDVSGGVHLGTPRVKSFGGCINEPCAPSRRCRLTRSRAERTSPPARAPCSTSADRTGCIRWRSAGATPLCRPRFSICPKRSSSRRHSWPTKAWALAWRTGRATYWSPISAKAYDVVFMSSLVHHFDEATNRELMKRIARALRPGGAVVVQELVRRESPTQGGQMGALLDLYFSLTSQGGHLVGCRDGRLAKRRRTPAAASVSAIDAWRGTADSG